MSDVIFALRHEAQEVFGECGASAKDACFTIGAGIVAKQFEFDEISDFKPATI